MVSTPIPGRISLVASPPRVMETTMLIHIAVEQPDIIGGRRTRKR